MRLALMSRYSQRQANSWAWWHSPIIPAPRGWVSSNLGWVIERNPALEIKQQQQQQKLR